jgi:Protein of unknown function (DUF2845)
MSTPFRFVLCALLLLALTPAAHALRCGNDLIKGGEYDFQVRDRCGDPFWVEDHYKIITTDADSGFQAVQQFVYTAWFYNFGSNRLLVRMLFRDGRFLREETLGRGVDDIGDSCGPPKLIRGMSSGELIAYCGEPLSRNSRPGAILRRLAPGTFSETDNYLEDWVYDLGGNFLYIMHLRNGHADSVEHIHR